jgi:OmpA-OmpF porin, OOP family
MNIKNRMIFTGLLGLLATSALMVGCSHDETQADYEAIASPSVVIKGEGSGIFTDIAISAASMFEFDSAELNDDGKAVIDEYRKNLGPELAEAYLVLVVGNTDSSGDERYNKALSLKRAESVADYLISTGLKADAIRVIGRGSEEPIASNDTREGRIQNRRVDILVVAEIRDLDTMVFPSAALFERKSAQLNEQGKALLEKNYKEASDQLARASYIEIVGYTDNVGEDDDNMALSKKRAASVRDFLIAKGVDASKMVTTGKGEAMPIASNDTAEGRAQNRRVEILILGRIKDKQ